MALPDIALKTIDGRDDNLANHLGEVLLIVNTASQCGLTPQYAALEALHERYADRGFRVLGFPSNDFKGQEPGSDAEIAGFCETSFGVTFPMFAKTPVNGAGRHPLYAALTEALPDATAKPGSDFADRVAKSRPADARPSDISWNFEKFVIGRDGEPVARFAPDMAPDDDMIVRVIERELQPGADV